jgi:hypothetical protein
MVGAEEAEPCALAARLFVFTPAGAIQFIAQIADFAPRRLRHISLLFFIAQ